MIELNDQDILIRLNNFEDPFTERKVESDIKDILKYLEGENKIFLIGCGECSTACKTGGEEEVKKIKEMSAGMRAM